LSLVIAKWLAIFSENFRHAITDLLPEIWLEALKDMEPCVFENACSKYLQAGHFFPSIADIRDSVRSFESPARALGEDANTEAAWLHCLAYANRWHPDCDPPRGITLTAPEARSLQVAGGIYQLWTIQDEGGTELAFMRRAFFESFKRRDAVAGALSASRPPRELPDKPFKSISEIIVGGKPQ
jgi:hypothetical protein